MGQPLVSVVMPVRNAGRYVEAALASMCAQDYSRQEIIVIDDGSTDDTLARVERIADQDSRVRVVSKPHRGLIASLNDGIALAQGELIARMDGDDIAYPSRISSQVQAFVSTPGLALCAAAVDMLEMGRLWRTPDPGAGCDLRVLGLFLTIFIHPTVVFDRRVLGDTLHYDPRYPHAEDFDLFRRILSAWPVQQLSTPLLAYRLHRSRVSFLHRRIQQSSHLRIVAENLRADGFDLDTEALPALAGAGSPEALDRAIAFLDELDAAVAATPPHLRGSYQAGVSHLHHFLRNVLLDGSQALLLCNMLSRTGRWGTLRRRERLILRLAAPIPAMASFMMHQSNQFQRLVEFPASRPAAGLMSRLSPVAAPTGASPATQRA